MGTSMPTCNARFGQYGCYFHRMPPDTSQFLFDKAFSRFVYYEYDIDEMVKLWSVSDAIQ